MKPYFEDDAITIYHGDCREILPTLEPVDLVLTDPPYGITANSWDIQLPASEMLSGFHTVVMTASQPFAAQMVCADLKRFRHEWVWVKNRGSNFTNSMRQPMKEHETVLVFSDGKWTYNPQMQLRAPAGLDRIRYKVNNSTESSNYRDFGQRDGRVYTEERGPSSVQFFNRATDIAGAGKTQHPTQKPLALFMYLVETYSNEGETILDPFMGSGTTLRAAKDLGRKAIGIEVEERYCEVAVNRMAQAVLL